MSCHSPLAPIRSAIPGPIRDPRPLAGKSTGVLPARGPRIKFDLSGVDAKLRRLGAALDDAGFRMRAFGAMLGALGIVAEGMGDES